VLHKRILRSGSHSASRLTSPTTREVRVSGCGTSSLRFLQPRGLQWCVERHCSDGTYFVCVKRSAASGERTKYGTDQIATTTKTSEKMKQKPQLRATQRTVVRVDVGSSSIKVRRDCNLQKRGWAGVMCTPQSTFSTVPREAGEGRRGAPPTWTWTCRQPSSTSNVWPVT